MEKAFWVVIVIGIFLLLFYTLKTSRGKHHRNVKKATVILKKLRSFTGEGVDGRVITYLRKINPYVFEELLLTAFKENGYRITRNMRYSGDGGIDGKVSMNGKNYVVQAKRYVNYIKEEHINELYACIRRESADGGFFIHTGKTGKDKMNRHRNGTIEIISGQKLATFILNKSDSINRQFSLTQKMS